MKKKEIWEALEPTEDYTWIYKWGKYYIVPPYPTGMIPGKVTNPQDLIIHPDLSGNYLIFYLFVWFYMFYFFYYLGVYLYKKYKKSKWFFKVKLFICIYTIVIVLLFFSGLYIYFYEDIILIYFINKEDLLDWENWEWLQ